MIQNSKDKGFSFKGKPTTTYGKSLIDICAENKLKVGLWRLQDIQSRLINEGSDKYSINKKERSADDYCCDAPVSECDRNKAVFRKRQRQVPNKI